MAEVCVASLYDSAAKDKVVEIFENEAPGAVAPPKDKWFYGLKM